MEVILLALVVMSFFSGAKTQGVTPDSALLGISNNLDTFDSARRRRELAEVKQRIEIDELQDRADEASQRRQLNLEKQRAELRAEVQAAEDAADAARRQSRIAELEADQRIANAHLSRKQNEVENFGSLAETYVNVGKDVGSLVRTGVAYFRGRNQKTPPLRGRSALAARSQFPSPVPGVTGR